ncbi:MAG TPA: hypothetical protein VK762_33455 [Polyangiaceae bacterium]|jgi:hypothetical protein|nr:hypothetical protein [Polyangiaceae bacterium]
MAAPAGFLYGDATPSPLKSDFIAFLRDAVDYAATALGADARMAAGARDVERLAEQTEREIGAAEELATDVARALEGPSLREPASLAGRCAVRLQLAARDLVRSESDTARAAIAAERNHLAQRAAKDFEACTKAFEALVLAHTLPDALGVTVVNLGAGARYDAILECQTPYGLEWTTELEVPANHALARVLRIDRLFDRLEVEAPEEGGWINKEVRNRPQRLDRLYLMGLSVHPSETAIRLRSGQDGTGVGFDILLQSEPSRVQLVRIVEGGGAAEGFHNVVGDDAEKLYALRDSLVALTGELADHKKSLRTATLGGTPLSSLESPRLLVDQVLASIAPTVREIAKRSLAPGELVIKRLVGDSRREEVFVSKKELRQKVESLSPDLRAAFDPLELWDDLPKVIVAADSGPPPAPAPAPSPSPPRTVSASPIQMIASPPSDDAPQIREEELYFSDSDVPPAPPRD